ncbi:MAG TPA: CPBP family intramembrane glutamic endopeptidase [Phnomibacter sp.]|nr:CPBP family intramembrane glutamic endopeptidase [Phnomibacter sp.]
MLGILVQLAISWLIIWWIEKQHLSVLGFMPNRQRVQHFFVFFCLAAGFCALGFLLKMWAGNQHWKINPQLNFSLIMKGLEWNINSVLYEELIFRGVLLYILIKRLGVSTAIIISAIGFGIYHWFSMGVLGNPVPMIIIFIMTGLMGYVLALGYAKTYSLYLPIGLHFGWNLTQIFIFSNGPIGPGTFVPVGSGDFRTNSYLLFFAVTFLPIFLLLFCSYLLIRRMKQENG